MLKLSTTKINPVFIRNFYVLHAFLLMVDNNISTHVMVKPCFQGIEQDMIMLKHFKDKYLASFLYTSSAHIFLMFLFTFKIWNFFLWKRIFFWRLFSRLVSQTVSGGSGGGHHWKIVNLTLLGLVSALLNWIITWVNLWQSFATNK